MINDELLINIRSNTSTNTHVSIWELLSSLITIIGSVNCFLLPPLIKWIGFFKVLTATSTSSTLSWHINLTSLSVTSSLLSLYTKESNTGYTWLLESSLILLTTQKLKKRTNKFCQYVFDFTGFNNLVKDLEE